LFVCETEGSSIAFAGGMARGGEGFETIKDTRSGTRYGELPFIGADAENNNDFKERVSTAETTPLTIHRSDANLRESKTSVWGEKKKPELALIWGGEITLR